MNLGWAKEVLGSVKIRRHIVPSITAHANAVLNLRQKRGFAVQLSLDVGVDEDDDTAQQLRQLILLLQR